MEILRLLVKFFGKESPFVQRKIYIETYLPYVFLVVDLGERKRGIGECERVSAKVESKRERIQVRECARARARE